MPTLKKSWSPLILITLNALETVKENRKKIRMKGRTTPQTAERTKINK